MIGSSELSAVLLRYTRQRHASSLTVFFPRNKSTRSSADAGKPARRV